MARIVVGLALLGGLITPAVSRGAGMYNLLIENDVFTGTDRHYSNGVHLSWLSAQDDVPDYIRGFANAMPLIRPNALLRAGYAIGHNLYTPNDITNPALIPNERPYAGYLYGGFAVVADAGTILDTWALDLGIVGPSARGEAVQNNFHRLIGSPQAQGWDNQLKDEVTLSLTHERKWRNLWEYTDSGFGAGLTPHLGISIGNLSTYLNAGLALRVGENLARDYGPPRIRPSLPGSAFFTPSKQFSWYLYAGVDGRAVARNIFLDGNTWQDSHHVDSKTWVGDLQMGAVLTFPDFRLAYTHVFRSREFAGQAEGDHFGAISLTAFF
jgi:hypothetical protein